MRPLIGRCVLINLTVSRFGMAKHGLKVNTDENEVNKYSGYVYDAVWLYAIALDNLIK